MSFWSIWFPPVNLWSCPKEVKVMKAGEIEGFDGILENAEARAESEWEMGFVADIQDRYDEYEDDCHISETQLEKLKEIAGVL